MLKKIVAVKMRFVFLLFLTTLSFAFDVDVEYDDGLTTTTTILPSTTTTTSTTSTTSSTTPRTTNAGVTSQATSEHEQNPDFAIEFGGEKTRGPVKQSSHSVEHSDALPSSITSRTLSGLRTSYAELKDANENLPIEKKCLCDVILARAFSILLERLGEAEEEVKKISEILENERDARRREDRAEYEANYGEELFEITDSDFEWFENVDATSTQSPPQSSTTQTVTTQSTNTARTTTASPTATTSSIFGQVKTFDF